jgi:hypothetical protein
MRITLDEGTRSNLLGHTQIYIYIYVCTGVPPYPLIQYPRFTAPEKKMKVKEISGSKVSKRAPSETGP